MAGASVAAVRPTSSRGRTTRIASGAVSQNGRRPSPISEGSPSVSYSYGGEATGAKFRSNSTLSTSASSQAPGAAGKAKSRNPNSHIRGQSTNSRSTADTAVTSSPPSAGSSTASAATTTSPPGGRSGTQTALRAHASGANSNPSANNPKATTASSITRTSNSTKSSTARAPSAPVARAGSRTSSQRGVATQGKTTQPAQSQRTAASAGVRRPSPTASLSSAPNLTRGRTPSAPSSSASVRTKRPTTPTSAKIAAAASGGKNGGRTGTPGSTRGTAQKQNSPSRKRLPSSGRGTANPVVRSSPTPSIRAANQASSNATPTRAASATKTTASASRGATQTKTATASSPVTQSTSVGTSSSPRSQSVTLVPLSPASSTTSSVSSFRPNAIPASHQTNFARRRTAESAPAVSNRGDGNAGSTSSYQAPDKAALALLAASNMADGLSAVRDGPHATIVKLRRLLDEASRRDSSAKTNLAKSDAIILELRKSLRELKVKLTTVEGERDLQARRVVESRSEIGSLKSDLGTAQSQLGRAEKEIRKLRNGVDRTDRDAVVGEMQVKLDQAHAKLLTAEMAQRGMEEDHQNEMNEMEIMVAQRDSEIEGLKEECENLTQTIMERDEALQSLADTVEDLQEEVRRGVTRGSNITALNSRLEASRMKLADTEHALASTQEQLQEARQLVKHLDTSREEAESKAEAVQQELAHVTEERDALLNHQSRGSADMDFHPTRTIPEDPDGEPSDGDSGENVHQALHLKDEELQKSAQRVAQLEASVEEQTRRVESLRQENESLQSRIFDEEKNKSSASSVASSDRLIRLQAERQTLLRSKHELEDRLRKMQGQLDIVDKEREELQRSLEAMREIQSRSSADSEIQAVHEMSVERERLKRQVGELQLILDERNIELLSLRSRLEGAESRASEEDVVSRSSRTTSRSGTRGGAALGGGASGSTPSVTSAKNRALARRIASETKLRERLGNVARLMGDSNGAAAIANGGDATSSASERGGLTPERGGVISRHTRRPSASSSTGPSPVGSMVGGEPEEAGGAMLAEIETLRTRLQTTEAELEEARRELVAAETRNKQDVGNAEKSLTEVEHHAAELEANLAKAREDLAAREEECTALRQSLQEAQETIVQLNQEVEAPPPPPAVPESTDSQNSAASGTESRSNVPADEENKDKQRRIEELEEELQRATDRVKTREAQVAQLQAQISSMEKSLRETKAELAKMKSASSSAANSRVSTSPKTMSGRVYKGNPTDDVKLRETEAELQKTLEEVKTRRNTERSLKQALRDAQSRLTKVTKEQTVMVKERDEMSKRVAPLEAHISTLERELAAAKKEVTKTRKELSNAVASTREQVRTLEARIERKDKELHETKTRAETAEQELKAKNKTLAKLREDLRVAQERGKMSQGNRSPPAVSRNKVGKETEQLKAEVEAGSEKVKELEAELLSALEELQTKTDEEEKLSKSLNDALALLKPLQGHVETAEREKENLAVQLEEAQLQLEAIKAKGSAKEPSSRGAEFTKLKSEKESLEKEARELRKELERASAKFKVDPSMLKPPSGMESEVVETEKKSGDENERVRELEYKLSEMKDRYETTKSKLDEASQTNMSLLEDLKQIEEEEANATEELRHLRRRLFEAEQERDTAQQIATTALKKVEEMSGGGDGTPGGVGNSTELSSAAGPALSSTSPAKPRTPGGKPAELQSTTPLSQRVKALNQSIQQTTDASSRDTRSPATSAAGLTRPRRGDITQRYRAALQKTSARDFRNPSRIPVVNSSRPTSRPPTDPVGHSPEGTSGAGGFGAKLPTKHPTEDDDEEDDDDPRVKEMNEIMNRLERPDDVSSIAEEI